MIGQAETRIIGVLKIFTMRRILLIAVSLSLISLLLWNMRKTEVMNATVAKPVAEKQSKPPGSLAPVVVAPAPQAPVVVKEQGDAIGAFDLWLRRWRTSPAADRTAMIDEGVKLAERR